jgi:hypothetical protein
VVRGVVLENVAAVETTRDGQSVGDFLSGFHTPKVRLSSTLVKHYFQMSRQPLGAFEHAFEGLSHALALEIGVKHAGATVSHRTQTQRGESLTMRMSNLCSHISDTSVEVVGVGCTNHAPR